MISQKQYNYLFYSLLSFFVVILLLTVNTLSISYKEALNVFVNNSVLSYITNLSIYFFSQNDYSLRIPFILFYVLSVLLMYALTKNYFKYEKDRFINILIFMLLPGVLSASLLVNSAIIVTFFLLLYIYLYNKTNEHNYYLLFLYLLIDNSFAILFLAIFFYEIRKKEKKILIISITLFIVSLVLYGFETNGKPKGYFVDTFAIYATIFSPLLFIYFFYTMYRVGLKENKTLIWYISASALIISLLFSFRQRVYIEDFAPFVVISLPLMLKVFFHSYRVRLPIFRKKHNIAIFFVLVMLFINVLLTIVNKPLYLYIPNEKKHFVYNYHFIKELSEILKEKNINYIDSKNEELLLRLKFYGIKKGNKYFISNDKLENSMLIEIKYYNKVLYKVYVKKI